MWLKAGWKETSKTTYKIFPSPLQYTISDYINFCVIKNVPLLKYWCSLSTYTHSFRLPQYFWTWNVNFWYSSLLRNMMENSLLITRWVYPYQLQGFHSTCFQHQYSKESCIESLLQWLIQMGVLWGNTPH
jgi:hypothetical protein